jgi:signal transduction histidine kinase
VISNLFLNALDACPRKGKLCVRLYESREWANSQKPGVRIVIGDTGAGIRSEDRPHLFEPFFTTKGEKGTGLGLWVSQGIVARHEGAMRFRSSVRPGRSGTVFSVFLPFREHKPGRTASPQSEGHVISGQ